MRLISIAIFTISMAVAVVHADSTTGTEDVFRSNEQQTIKHRGLLRGRKLYGRSVIEKRLQPNKEQKQKEEISKVITEFTKLLVAQEASEQGRSATPQVQPQYYYINNAPPAPNGYSSAPCSGTACLASSPPSPPPPASNGCAGTACPPPEGSVPPAIQALLPPGSVGSAATPGFNGMPPQGIASAGNTAVTAAAPAAAAVPAASAVPAATAPAKKKEEDSEEGEEADDKGQDEDKEQEEEEKKEEEEKSKEEEKEDQDEPEEQDEPEDKGNKPQKRAESNEKNANLEATPPPEADESEKDPNGSGEDEA